MLVFVGASWSLCDHEEPKLVCQKTWERMALTVSTAA
jgi:hypothetical protein